MQLAQAAKEKMHAPAFSLAASAAATTRSEGTNPIPQPDAGHSRQHVFFKTNPTSAWLARNSRPGHQLPTAAVLRTAPSPQSPEWCLKSALIVVGLNLHLGLWRQ